MRASAAPDLAARSSPFPIEDRPLRPWLFKIAHNAAVDFLKSHGRSVTEPRVDLSDVAGFDDAPDPSVLRAALARFVALPLGQRSAVILKDVLGHSLEETAETMGTTVMAVKALLVRGRSALRDPKGAGEAGVSARPGRSRAVRDAVQRPRLGRPRRPDRRRLPPRSRVEGRAAGQAGRDVLRPLLQGGRLAAPRAPRGDLALAAYVAGAAKPAYFIFVAWRDGRIHAIRDFRYVPYIAAEAEFEIV